MGIDMVCIVSDLTRYQDCFCVTDPYENVIPGLAFLIS